MNHCLRINSLNENLKCAQKFVVHLFKTHQNKVCLPHKLSKSSMTQNQITILNLSAFFITEKPFTYILEGGNFGILDFETSLNSLKVRQSQKQIMLSSILQKTNETHYPEHLLYSGKGVSFLFWKN